VIIENLANEQESAKSIQGSNEEEEHVYQNEDEENY